MSTSKAQVVVIDYAERRDIKAKILHLLGIYPVVSPTMLQGGLGPSLKPKLWRPALTELITEGHVIQEQESRETHLGRYNMYTLIRLPGTKVQLDGVEDAEDE